MDPSPEGGGARDEGWIVRWTGLAVRFPWTVLAFWAAVVAAGGFAASALPAHLSNSLAVPGSDSDRARSVLARAFGERPDGSFTVVFRARHRSPAAKRALERRLVRAARVLPGGRAGPLMASGSVVYADVTSPLGLQQAKRYTGALRQALFSSAGPTALLTGAPAIQHDVEPVLASDLRRGEALALPAALLVLALVLGLSAALGLPLLTAVGTIIGSLLSLELLAHVLPMASYVTNVGQLLGLGLAIDYSLLILLRFREELARGEPVEHAISRTAATAGRTVVFSGLTVTLGLALLSCAPVPFIRSLGIAGAIVPLWAVSASLTIQPALLSLLGRRTFASPRFFRRRRSARPEGQRFWPRLARSIVRRPVPALLLGTALVAAAALPAGRLALTPTAISELPRSLPSLAGYRELARGIGVGAITPTHVVVDGGAPGKARPGTAAYAAAQRLAADLYGGGLTPDPEVRVVASGPTAPYVDPSGRYTRVIVAGRHEYGARASRRFVDRLRERLIPNARFPAGSHVYVGGAPAQGVDFLARTYETFRWLLPAVLLLTYLLLLRAFRSLLLPLEAVLMNLLSVAAAYGLLVLVFRYGVGASLLGVRRAPELEGWVPVVLFATLFGLSMDYEVFIVSRMREAWDDTHDTSFAIASGLERSGRVVSAAALIMAIAFSGFVDGRIPGLQQFGLGLCLAVALDATLIRMLLVPAMMTLLGRWNWWLPARAARLVRVRPSPLAGRAT